MAADPKRLISRLETMKSNRTVWNSLWDDIIKYVTPLQTLSSGVTSAGISKMAEVYDGTAINGNTILASGLYGFLCPPHTKWFSFKAKDNEVNEDYGVRQWLQSATDRMHEELAESNFGLEVFQLFLTLSSIGTPCMYEEAGERNSLNFRTKHISEFYIAENKDGLVDTLFSPFSYTSRQAVQHFGIDNVGEGIKKAYEAEKFEESFKFLHATYPREDYDKSKRDNVNMPFASVYVDIKDEKIISESGYKEFPFMVPRWMKASGEIYARSPSSMAMADIRMLNQMSYTIIRAGQKEVDPPVNAPASMEGRVNLKPRAINFYENESRDRVEPIKSGGNLTIGMELEDQRRDLINRVYFVDLFLALSSATKQMTIPEVQERLQEKLIVLAPILGRLQSELFDPLLYRSFELCKRGGVFGEIDEDENLIDAPEALRGQPLEVEYTSKLARAMKMTEVGSFSSAMEIIGSLSQAFPDIFDNVDYDDAARGIMERHGVPAAWVRNWEVIKEMREARQEQVANDAMAAKVEQAAKITKDLSGKVDPTSVMKGMEESPAAIEGGV
ncbi:MAG: head-tail connector protein [Proteobacteria bacterium]|nr:head-tail connector protein [Pseudomonadota bacterium]